VLAGRYLDLVCRPEFVSAAPSQEAADDPAVRAPCVFVADAGLEKFIGGKGGVGSTRSIVSTQPRLNFSVEHGCSLP
jgi:uncharacterized protein (DUF362 family)